MPQFPTTSSANGIWQLGEQRNNAYGGNWPSVATYSLSASSPTVNEGGTVTFTLTANNVQNGTTIPYTCSGTITQADLTAGDLSGNFVVQNQTASISFSFTNDATSEGSETLTVNVFSISATTTVQDTSITPYAAEILVVAGGGGGGVDFNNGDGGGGGGGYQTTTYTFTGSPASFVVTVGAGGTYNANGGNSSIGTVLSCTGGGKGASFSNIAAGSGGSGGGGRGGGPSDGGGGPGGGISGQGSSGGQPSHLGGESTRGGGGGGKSAVGGNAGDNSSGRGGNGLAWVDNVIRAGGGGGGVRNVGSFGGNGNGGGNTANRGGGGSAGSSGGSGVVILRYVGAQRGAGGTVTSSGGYTYHTFNTSGNYYP